VIDPRYQYFNNKIIVSEEKENVEILQDILADFINGKRMTYYKMFLEELSNMILKIYNKNNEIGDADIVTEFSDLSQIDISRKIIYFKPFIMTDLDIVQTE
jgi:hypothetical protein